MKGRDVMLIGAGALLLGGMALAAGASGGTNGGVPGPELHPQRAALTQYWIWPVPRHPDGRAPSVSDGVRVREGGRAHLGVDLMYRAPKAAPALPTRSEGHEMPNGIRALAVARGKVSVSADGATGGLVRIWHPGNLVTQYLHLAQRFVSPGQVVEQGQAVGIIGYDLSGYRLNHLHFELLVGAVGAGRDQYLDPEPYLRRWRVVT
jgi:murein DD-endopeptidase MepM/ murein hydrolase activator NlpD